MATLRKHLTSGFTSIPNEALRDPRLSFKATGILAVLLTHSDGWNISSASLARGKPDGLSAVRSGYAELAAAGYLKREQTHGSGGRIETVIHVSDTALPSWESHVSQDGSCDQPTPVEPTTVECTPIEEQGEKEQLEVQDLTPSSATADGDGPGAPAPSSPERSSTATASEMEDPTRAVARRVLAEWISAVGRDPARTKLTGDRLTKVRARLRDGYTEEDLIGAVRGIGMSPWHMGSNPEGKRWDDLTLALRDGTKVEHFRDLAASGPGRRVTGAELAVAEMMGAQR